MIVTGLACGISLSLLLRTTHAHSKQLHFAKDFYYWLEQPRDKADYESQKRLANVYKAVMLYSADNDSHEFSMYGLHKMYGYIRTQYTGTDGKECFQSPLAPPEILSHSKLGFFSNVPLDIKDNIFGSGLSRNELYEKDPSNYPVLVDPFIDAVHGKPGEPVLLNILYTNGEVKQITASQEYH
ncbi:MAG: hypothetical protein KF836_08135 [Fimbriimonadaceae bacterium]|nr:hypothetical protein [Fimbriimonadaceae bacterium]